MCLSVEGVILICWSCCRQYESKHTYFHLKLVFVWFWLQESSELNVLIDYPALHMQQISTSTVAQCTAGLSPLIGPVVRLLVTSETKVKLNSMQTQISLMRRCSKVKPRVCRQLLIFLKTMSNNVLL